MNQSEFIKIIQEIVRTELSNLSLLKGDWHFGKVQGVVDSKYLSVYVDGNSVAQKVPYNPSITFATNDNVIVIYLNGNSNDKFVICKRNV